MQKAFISLKVLKTCVEYYLFSINRMHLNFRIVNFKVKFPKDVGKLNFCGKIMHMHVNSFVSCNLNILYYYNQKLFFFSGFWYLHCHMDAHLTEGMALIIKEGERSLHPKPPKGFPSCGDFTWTINESQGVTNDVLASLGSKRNSSTNDG